jgi:hypothetical protein
MLYGGAESEKQDYRKEEMRRFEFLRVQILTIVKSIEVVWFVWTGNRDL